MISIGRTKAELISSDRKNKGDAIDEKEIKLKDGTIAEQNVDVTRTKAELVLLTNKTQKKKKDSTIAKQNVDVTRTKAELMLLTNKTQKKKRKKEKEKDGTIA